MRGPRRSCGCLRRRGRSWRVALLGWADVRRPRGRARRARDAGPRSPPQRPARGRHSRSCERRPDRRSPARERATRPRRPPTAPHGAPRRSRRGEPTGCAALRAAGGGVTWARGARALDWWMAHAPPRGRPSLWTSALRPVGPSTRRPATIAAGVPPASAMETNRPGGRRIAGSNRPRSRPRAARARGRRRGPALATGATTGPAGLAPAKRA